MDNPTLERAGAVLTVHLDAVVANWRAQAEAAAPALCAAVVKADAYGLGARAVVPALVGAGCVAFFVATIDEALAIRALARETAIHVLNGPYPGTTGNFLKHRLIPVLNTPAQIAQWAAEAAGAPCAVHVDTGMSRLGLTEAEVHRLAADAATRARLNLRLLISHLACAEDRDEPMNAAQLARFRALRAELGDPPASLANSSGIRLGPDYLFDVTRPGASLYGVNPTPDRPNPMRPAVTLMGRIVQVRDARPGDTVGYGATHVLPKGGRVATVAVGYADGYLRALSERGIGFLGGREVRLIGRVSMDLTTFDVSAVPEAEAHPGAWIELLGENVPVDFLAARADTIGYEILTALGRRYARRYVEGGQG